MKKKKAKIQLSKTEQQLLDGVRMVRKHPFFGQLRHLPSLLYERKMSKNAFVLVNQGGELYMNDHADCSPEQWAWAIVHAMLHRAFGHFDLEKVPGFEVEGIDGKKKKIAKFDIDLWNIACDIYVNRFLNDLSFGRPLRNCSDPMVPQSKMTDEVAIYNYLREINWSTTDHSAGTAEITQRDMLGLENPIEYDPKATGWRARTHNVFSKDFAFVLSHSVVKAVSVAAGRPEGDEKKKTDAQKAAAWFLNHYPMFGGMAAAFKLKEDALFCHRQEIQVAAVNAEEGELYINPAVGLNEEEWRFVLAHEFLHVGLQHHKRQQGRDPYIWNVACDYVINGWLREMEVGKIPEGVLFDPAFKDESAEEIYDRIIRDARRYAKMQTLRGYGKGDVLTGWSKSYQRTGGVALDDFFRDALMSGLEYQLESGRGTIPAGMVQEIRALAMPPIPWDVKLANWFDENVITKEKHRSYAHPSRRQGSTPDIPRPRYVRAESDKMATTFGVIIDTSGSMSAEAIGKALGSIASYATAKDVPAARVVFCDADAYDAGYIETDAIAGRVKVIGRGGTLLQPAVDLLEKAKDFPKDGPILLITDGWIEDNLKIRRRHAFLLPPGGSLPFRSGGEVFHFE